MSDTKGVITINEVVKEYLQQSRISPMESIRVFQMCLNGIRECNLFDIRESRKTVKLAMDGNYIATLPEDFVSMIKLGMPFSGKIWTYTKDEDIITTTTELDGEEVLIHTDGEGVSINPEYYEGYGAKGGINREGYYKFDYPNHRIIFRNVSRSEVLLEYASSGVSLTGVTFVPVTIKPTLKAFINLEMIRYRPDVPDAKKDYAERQLEKERGKLRLITMPTLQEISDAWLSENSLAPTRL
jgi:hypothetical protein